VKPTFWRTLGELEGTPEFQSFLEREFATPLENDPPNSPERRRFMQLMGASFALAGVATGCRWEQDKLLPQARRPQGQIPGEQRAFNTAMELGGAAVGLRVASYDGRPIKVEGNPDHPSSRGATTVLHQAAILGIYDPDRSTVPTRREGGSRASATWEDFEAFARPHFAKLRAAAGRGLHVLVQQSSSPTFADLKARFTAQFPEARITEWEPVSRDNERAGSQLAFGGLYRTQLALEKADLILSLDADLVVGHPGGPGNGRRLASRRSPDGDSMNRLYVVESSFSPTGTLADHRLPLRSELIAAFACALDARVSEKLAAPAELGPAQSAPAAEFLKDAKVAKFLDVVAKDLIANAGKSLIVAGPQQPAEVHALVHRLNRVLGNVGNTLEYTEELEPARPSHDEGLKALVAELKKNSVDTLLVLGGNPVYAAPADLDFAGALSGAKAVIHLGLYEDETGEVATWHLPETHWLETWSDARAWDGTVTLAQPLIAPLHGGRSALEILAFLVGEPSKPLDLVKRTHQARFANPRAWARVVQDGSVPETRFAPANPTLKPLPKVQLSPRALAGLTLGNGQLELTFAPDHRVYDGRFANNAWLQELPDPFTKLTWDNAVLIAPKTAQALGIEDGQLVLLKLDGRELTLPALHAPGQAAGSLRVTLGYGRTAAGVVAGSRRAGIPSVGANAYRLRTSSALWLASGASIAGAARLGEHKVATTSHLHAIDPIGKQGEEQRLGAIVREASLAEYKQHPEFAKHAVHHPPLLNLWKDPVSYEGRKWGMSIDLNKCIGCSACMVACQSENNVPVVGKEQVLMGREMHWLRVDRYYRGEPDEAEITNQPLPCQHCENAPCEQVCPVGATMHSHEGLNDMVYNRCIGTRYCSNNCPYKVRRFNYFNYNLDYQDPKKQVQRLALNPDVTVRARGVMEKCTFCVQRIQNTKIKAKNSRRGIKDGEVQTACQQACPTEAIVFGDLNDKESAVVKTSSVERAYALLGELNNRPRVAYLARVRNRHPELDTHHSADAGGHHGGGKPAHGAETGGHQGPQGDHH
jgi:molybdopterin-containing oxidoreductase family iron-sulfur binding subunit